MLQKKIILKNVLVSGTLCILVLVGIYLSVARCLKWAWRCLTGSGGGDGMFESSGNPSIGATPGAIMSREAALLQRKKERREAYYQDA